MTRSTTLCLSPEKIQLEYVQFRTPSYGLSCLEYKTPYCSITPLCLYLPNILATDISGFLVNITIEPGSKSIVKLMCIEAMAKGAIKFHKDWVLDDFDTILPLYQSCLQLSTIQAKSYLSELALKSAKKGALKLYGIEFKKDSETGKLLSWSLDLELVAV